MNPNIIEIIDEESIIQASSIKLDEGLRPRRVVLRHVGRKFITHDEYLTIRVETREVLRDNGSDTYDYVVCEHESFDQGNYFDYGVGKNDEAAAYAEAKEDFNKRAGGGRK